MADVPVTREIAQQALRRLRTALPAHLKLMPIGGTVMERVRPEGVTKDLDIAVAVVEDDVRIPDAGELAAALATTCQDVEVRKDQTNVTGSLPLEAGRVRVEAIRGKRRGGYFVSRHVLKAIVAVADERDGILEIPLEALAFLKAWAAHDKQKLVDQDKDPTGYHASRREGFQSDVRAIGDFLLDRGDEPRADILASLFQASSRDRRKAIAGVFHDAGWGATMEGLER